VGRAAWGRPSSSLGTSYQHTLGEKEKTLRMISIMSHIPVSWGVMTFWKRFGFRCQGLCLHHGSPIRMYRTTLKTTPLAMEAGVFPNCHEAGISHKTSLILLPALLGW
jgi:hypothetical protein